MEVIEATKDLPLAVLAPVNAQDHIGMVTTVLQLPMLCWATVTVAVLTYCLGCGAAYSCTYSQQRDGLRSGRSYIDER